MLHRLPPRCEQQVMIWKEIFMKLDVKLQKISRFQMAVLLISPSSRVKYQLTINYRSN